jgi:predicted HAD superfamily phosphohydrolase YqeG
MLASVWSEIKGQMISTISEHLVLAGAALTASFIFGMTFVTPIDSYYPLKRGLQKRCKLLVGAEIVALAATGSTIFSLFGRINSKIVVTFLSLTTGFILGMQAHKHDDGNNDQKINEFVEKIKNSQFNQNDQLDLSNYYSSLRHFNLVKLGKKIQESFKPSSYWSCTTLILSNCQLRDTDLQQLADAGWFSNFQKIDLSDNARLTHRSLVQIAKAADHKLEILDLTRVNLTDDDLEQMACSGFFKQLRTLILCDNPHLTGKGIAWIAQKGFESLQILDLRANSQILKKGFQDWLETDGFKNLEVLDLSATDIGENELQQMIEKTDWFKNLKGLNVSCCNHLKKFPPNISMLIQLKEHGISSSLSGGNIYYQNQGLFFIVCTNLTYTQEIFQLVKDGKAFGGKKDDEGLLQKAGRELDLPEMCRVFKVSYE